MKQSTNITAALLYDLIQCPHRPTMDLFGDPSKRDEIGAFVQLLWEKGKAFEHEVIDGLKVPICDLSGFSGDEKESHTFEAMRRCEPLIYSGRISGDDLLGEPDLLRREGDGYVAGDIKSGSGVGSGSKLKKHYGVQLALYTDILERREFASSRRPFVWDVHHEEVTYDLDAQQGKRPPWTMWEIYQEALARAQGIVARTEQTDSAVCPACKNCHWRTACLQDLENSDDLTLLFDLGRSKRDVMRSRISTVSELATINVGDFISGEKTDFPRISSAMLHAYHERAVLATTPGAIPYLKKPIPLPVAEKELFFDIEDDPMRDFCYLHGFVERLGGDNSTEQYNAFFADGISAEEEERAFAEAWQYISASQPCIIYYYSHHERTWWKKLQIRYPSVCSADDIKHMFSPEHSLDLYTDVVNKYTEWPTSSYSIKSLAKFLGFKWRDEDPSGAASIEWFHRWIQKGDTTIKQRILDYNEDDCRAMRVLLDGIRTLEVKK